MKLKLLLISLIAAISVGCNKQPQIPLPPSTTVANYSVDEIAIKVYKQALPSIPVVVWKNEDEESYRALGTAFVITYKNKAYIITAAHVVEPLVDDKGKPLKGNFYIRFPDDSNYIKVTPKSYGTNLTDIAILSTEKPISFPLLQVNITTPETGSDCYVIGYPLSYPKYMTQGIVNDNVLGYLMTTAPVAYGNSGGPLLNNKAEVIGIVVRIHPGWSQFAKCIPIRVLTDILD